MATTPPSGYQSLGDVDSPPSCVGGESEQRSESETRTRSPASHNLSPVHGVHRTIDDQANLSHASLETEYPSSHQGRSASISPLESETGETPIHPSDGGTPRGSADSELATTDIYGNPLPERLLRAQSEQVKHESGVSKWPFYSESTFEKLWGKKGILSRPNTIPAQKNPDKNAEKKRSITFKELAGRLKQTVSPPFRIPCIY